MGARMSHLKLTKHFLCSCPRCSDSEEVDRKLTGVRCNKCRGEAYVDIKPDHEVWICRDCDHLMDRKQVATIEAAASQMLKITQKHPRILEKAVNKLQEILCPSHYV